MRYPVTAFWRPGCHILALICRNATALWECCENRAFVPKIQNIENDISSLHGFSLGAAKLVPKPQNPGFPPNFVICGRIGAGVQNKADTAFPRLAGKRCPW
jgi:hypothetical protein